MKSLGSSMRNRAKCKLCRDELESLTRYDVVSCKCGEIDIWGGNVELRSRARDYGNFLRLDDEGKEIEVKVINNTDDKKEVPVTEEIKKEITREDKIKLVDAMLNYYEGLPQHVLTSAPTQYDLKAIYLLIRDCLT